MTEPRWLSNREQRAWRGLMDVEHALSAFIDRQLRTRCGLSHADYQVLAHLSEAPQGRLRSFELGDLLHWEKSRLSQHLTRMQGRGLVTRERAQTDQRGAVVAITPEGTELISVAARQHVSDARDAVIDQLSPDEVRTLATITDKIRARLTALEQATRPTTEN
ncbi:MarR family winged helix-turn-helix transcriptional regulator [Micromonospora sp. WMMD1155]|uniref:MarR family winged helix-turn-helix transcriptional regulator n=1 Tax=Micromonospora sp. WMMD1155 TaxID=3016094 RepID=UPI00249AC7A1|nr:MarR family winged helix-turn-helix transcriptional regulator [Micromonospora sp. WMMD1155]WFE53186.1 MarR family winged helix-turn-helix transcriptional regulator [Micromonospora sp. WMMD1155]